MSQEYEASQMPIDYPEVVSELNKTASTEKDAPKDPEDVEETSPSKRKFEEEENASDAQLYGDPIKPDTPTNPFQGATRARCVFRIDPDAIAADYQCRLRSGLSMLVEQVHDWRNMVNSFVCDNEGVTFEEEEHVMMTYRLVVPGQGSGTCSGILLGEFRNKAGRDIHLIFDPINETFNLIAEADDPEEDKATIRWQLAAEVQLPLALAQSELQNVDQPPTPRKKTKLELKCNELKDAIKSGTEYETILRDVMQEVSAQTGRTENGKASLEFVGIVQTPEAATIQFGNQPEADTCRLEDY